MNAIESLSFDELSLTTVLLNLAVCLALGMGLKWHFEKFSMVLSSKKEISRILPFLTLIVCLIISIVKSSLALSLGLVGALSIVRFRTPIKEPEELVYLFMAIAIGLGTGANMMAVTVVSSVLILLFVAIIRHFSRQKYTQNLYLSITSDNDSEDFAQAVKLIISQTKLCDLKRFDRSPSGSHLSFVVDVSTTDEIFKITQDIKEKYPKASVSFIDQSRIPGV
ncbi:MAG: DUF4956 domain-containing protein [Bdellovibrionales bacterium]